MKPSTWLPVLEHLSKGNLMSGSDLGSILNVSRAAIWQRVEYLKTLGVQIDATEIGYQLKYPVYLPDLNVIREDVSLAVDIDLEVSSTNTLVLEARLERCLITLYQSKGRGRRGKQWIAAPGHALMLSMGIWIDSGVQDLAGLSVDLGVSLTQALNGLGVDAHLKWPNDLWVDDRKLAGVLMELYGDHDRAFVVVGFGLNLWPTLGVEASIASINDLVDRQWTDIDTARLINELEQTIRNYPGQTSSDRIKRYNEVGLLNGREVQVTGVLRSISGIAQGIDEFGRLCILTDSGAEYVSAGDVSVRPQ